MVTVACVVITASLLSEAWAIHDWRGRTEMYVSVVFAGFPTRGGYRSTLVSTLWLGGMPRHLTT